MRWLTHLAVAFVVALTANGSLASAGADTSATRAATPWMDTPTLQALDRCIRGERPPQGAEPWERLVDVAERCPRIHRWLEIETREQRLVLGSANAPHYRALLNLRQLIIGNETAMARGVRFNLERGALDGILSSLSIRDEQEAGLWKRFISWLMGHFKSSGGDISWLDELLEAITPSEDVVAFVFKASLVLLVLLTLVLVGNEVRLFGWRGLNPRHRTPGTASEDDAKPVTATTSWAQLNRLAPRQQVATALQLLLQTISAQDAGERTAHARPESRTPRELLRAVSRARADSGIDYAAQVAPLLNQIERIIYGDENVDAPQAGALSGRCSQLAHALSATPEEPKHSGRS